MNRYIYVILNSLFCFFIGLFFVSELIERKKYENRNR